ncbi:hypothetical protein IPM65_02290 [Candidatus Roizmanbacteria bacterium]|nr:MAG: hypothetical protein IPM65_02290 [Candidatus Roizmanbacteria bacterium]
MLKKLIIAINMSIVTIILVPFYFLIIGAAFLIHIATRKKRISDQSFWEPFQITSDFTSPY